MYSISNIQTIIQGESTIPLERNHRIVHLLFDSRQLIFPATSLFFAIRAARNDGHQYIKTLYQKGVRNFVVEADFDSTFFAKANFIKVSSSLAALQILARHHRQQFELESIGITGSNGKTIIKEWLFQLLHKDYNIVRSPKSYNSQIGVPLSIWQIKTYHQLGIFEAGISQPQEMAKIAPIIGCQVGIFTNIGSAHNEGFESSTEKIQEKLLLFKDAKSILYCKDHQTIHEAIQQLADKALFSWSAKTSADLRILKTYKNHTAWTKIEAIFKGKTISIQIPFQDSASIENAIHCWAFLLYKNYPQTLIQTRMRQLEAVAMRLELKAGINACTIINDSYNSDLNGLRIALNFMEQQANHNRKTLILSDILESGLSDVELYQEVADLLANTAINRVIGIGKTIAQLPPFLNKKILTRLFPDTDAFLAQLPNFHFEKESILLKGARAFAFERISNRLVLKAHRTLLEVNLNALIHNLNIYSQYLYPTTKILVMVKASAYGSGSYEVARLLEFHKVDYLGVAYVDEGVELRKAGIQLPILVLNCEETVFASLILYQLEPEIYSLRQLEQFLQALTNTERPYPIHLKLDTGMHRLGFEAQHLEALSHILKENAAKVTVKSIFSHLAASDESIHDDFSAQQFDTFEKMYAQLVEYLGYRPFRHMLNSSGIVRFPHYQLDMVRLGIGLYGVDSSGVLKEQLQVVNRLKARISQIKTISKNETVGYSRKAKFTQKGRIATISIGYADGLLRQAGNGHFKVFLHQQLAPIVGNVCMDMCMIDISHIPAAKEGDEVEIFGSNHAVQQLADCLNTIPYEVFTNISDRVKRVYFQE